ncbi:flagellar biosynthetic protein FliO [Candidatus Clostridium radicumherbarum]|uniref:Flagellar protein n=1 Tax=Candidatus Clostridium radicumherbarum TaxID=3381662 RepID=A0ABW8TWJ3_9CLOT
MDSSFWFMLLKIFIFLPIILIIFYISMKFGGSKLQTLQNGRFIKVLERVALSKENSLLVVKIGEKGYVLSSCNGKIEKLIELEASELAQVEAVKELPQYKSFKDLYEKVFKKKED